MVNFTLLFFEACGIAITLFSTFGLRLNQKTILP